MQSFINRQPRGCLHFTRESSMRNLPLATIALSILCTGLMFLPQPLQAKLYFTADALVTGDLWRLISGHLVHADFSHWAWNALALLLLGGFLEVRSRKLLAYSLLSGIVAVDLLLLSPLAGIDQYCGMSGVLNTLLGVVLFCYWRETRSWLVVFSALLCFGKVLIEMTFDTSLLTNISWPPLPASHLAGVVGACVLLMMIGGKARFPGPGRCDVRPSHI